MAGSAIAVFSDPTAAASDQAIHASAGAGLRSEGGARTLVRVIAVHSIPMRRGACSAWP